eukprot:403359508
MYQQQQYQQPGYQQPPAMGYQQQQPYQQQQAYPQQQQQPYMQAPAPQVVMVQQNEPQGNCPSCKKGMMHKGRKWGCWTCLVCLFCLPGLCCKCAWHKRMKCVNCSHTVVL